MLQMRYDFCPKRELGGERMKIILREEDIISILKEKYQTDDVYYVCEEFEVNLKNGEHLFPCSSLNLKPKEASK